MSARRSLIEPDLSGHIAGVELSGRGDSLVGGGDDIVGEVDQSPPSWLRQRDQSRLSASSGPLTHSVRSSMPRGRLVAFVRPTSLSSAASRRRTSAGSTVARSHPRRPPFSSLPKHLARRFKLVMPVGESGEAETGAAREAVALNVVHAYRSIPSARRPPPLGKARTQFVGSHPA